MRSPALRYSKSLWSYNPIPRGCVLYLPLWNPNLSGAVFKSIDPFGHTCTVTGALWKPNGRYFDGSDDCITVPDTSCLDITDYTTLEAWVKREENITQCMMSKGGCWQIEVSPEGYILVGVNTTRWFWLESATILTPDTWYYIAMTYDGTNLKIYIYGVVDATRTVAGSIQTSSNDVKIGEE